MSLIILYSSSHLVLNSTHHGNNSVSFIDADDLCHGEERSRYGQAYLRRIAQHEAIYGIVPSFQTVHVISSQMHLQPSNIRAAILAELPPRRPRPLSRR
ncbi:MAG TPA: hypothetical protein VHJ19_07345 [Gammaproteobacteria bacterium]|nr:hypothetical protein [Gammaproteobacteria bacterium]